MACVHTLVVAALLHTAIVCVTAAVIPIPVLCYHQYNNYLSRFSVSPAQFDEQMAYLSAQGYTSITADQYLQAASGDGTQLPSKPILITFDDIIANALPTTAVMAKYNFFAVWFVVTGFADSPQGWSMSWTGLTSAMAAGWGMEIHAGPLGHTTNGTCSYYGCRMDGETDDQYRARVVADLDAGEQKMVTQLGLSSKRVEMIAVPFDDRGQGGKDAVVQAFMLDYMSARFRVVFHQDWGFKPGGSRRYRYEV